MNDTFWQVVIGSGIAALLLSVYKLYKSYLKESKLHNEKQGLAKASILVGLLGIITFGIGSIIGVFLGLISMKGKKYKALSILGLIISILTLLPWILVAIFGA